MTADLVMLHAVAGLDHETQEHLRLIKGDMDAIVKDKMEHIKMDHYEVQSIQTYIGQAMNEDLPGLTDGLRQSKILFAEAEERDTKKREVALNNATTFLDRVKVNLLAVQHEIEHHGDILQGGALDALKQVTGKLGELQKSFESHKQNVNPAEMANEYDKAIRSVGELAGRLQQVQFKPSAVGPPLPNGGARYDETPQPQFNYAQATF